MARSRRGYREATAPGRSRGRPVVIARVYREEMVEPVRAKIIARPLCPGLETAVAADFGHAIGSLLRTVVPHATWGRVHTDAHPPMEQRHDSKPVRRTVAVHTHRRDGAPPPTCASVARAMRTG